MNKFDLIYLEQVSVIAEKTTCGRTDCGCLIVRDNKILVTGFADSPHGLPTCKMAGHIFKTIIHDDNKRTRHCMRSIHAEQFAICEAAKKGISLENATLYCTMTPCLTCAKMIINCGIKRVVCFYRHQTGEESEQLLTNAGLKIAHKLNSFPEYKE